MTRSSKSRKLRTRTKKRLADSTAHVNQSKIGTQPAQIPALSKTDKRYMIGFAVMSLFITIGYWTLGGRNLFVFPALFCISVGVRSYWAGPLRKFADNG